MTVSHSEYFLRETLKQYGSGLSDFARENYTTQGRGTLFFHFTPVGSEFECEDVNYLDLSRMLKELQVTFGNEPDISMLQSLVESYNPTREFICCIVVSFPDGTFDMKFAKCGNN